MPKSTERAPRGTNVVAKAATEALAKLPLESRKAIAKAAWEKVKESLTSARTPKAGPKNNGRTKAAPKRRTATRARRITKESETANQVAA